MTPARGITYLVSPDSLRSWFARFADLADSDRVFFIGEEQTISADLKAAVEELPLTRPVVFYSSHDSMLRDLDYATKLRDCGHVIYAQTRKCAHLGLDKVAFKRFLDAHSFLTPSWGPGDEVPSGLGDVLVKDRRGTQSRNLHWLNADRCYERGGWYWERFVPGVEYSVLVYVDQRGTCFFPIIWKGPVSVDLLPPWKRLRLCPGPVMDSVTELSLLNTVERFLALVDCWGFLEFEFIVHDGVIYLLEINPRVCGVMRLAAMATGTPIFTLPARSLPQRRITHSRFAAEIPYDGAPWSSPDGTIIATSRLTAAAVTARSLVSSLRGLTAGSSPYADRVRDLLYE